MARLIDAMRIDFDEVDISGCTDADDIIWAVENLIDAQPTVDAVPVVHGRWFMRGGRFRCSSCDSTALLKLDSNVGGCREFVHFRSDYCPNCGAKMDLEVE